MTATPSDSPAAPARPQITGGRQARSVPTGPVRGAGATPGARAAPGTPAAPGAPVGQSAAALPATDTIRKKAATTDEIRIIDSFDGLAPSLSRRNMANGIRSSAG